MKKAEREEYESKIKFLQYDNKELRKNYLQARKDVATEIYGQLKELSKGQGGIVYDIDLNEIFIPYGVNLFPVFDMGIELQRRIEGGIDGEAELERAEQEAYEQAGYADVEDTLADREEE